MNNEENKQVKAEQIEEIECRAAIMSEAYADLLVTYEQNIMAAMMRYNAQCYEIINEKYAVLYTPLETAVLNPEALDVNVIPRVLGPYGISSMDASGIFVFHEQPYVPLRGSGIIIGLLDSGIDYTHPAFVYEDNTTKILSIWDQTLQEGDPPSNFQFGTEYTEVNINEALASENPFDIVPSRDELGHGTFLAGTAAGRLIEEENFVGAAPDADIIMVKLKPAKEYLRELYVIRDDAVIYQNTDIMLGIKFLVQKAAVYGRPLVICVGLGTNQGSHDGTSALEEYLAQIGNIRGYAVVIAAGNEADKGHHAMGHFIPDQPYEDIEIRVAPNEKGIGIQLWAQAPDIYSVALLSPTGEFISRIPARIGKRETIDLLLERTIIYVEYQLIEVTTGDELILIRLQEPTEGIWTIRVYGEVVVIGHYHLWLERDGWIDPATQFMNPTPFMTVTVPGTNEIPITVGAYNHFTNSVWIASGRGLTRDNLLKPSLVAPGVDVLGVLPNNQYGIRSGTSIAAAHVAGAAALLMEWGIINGNAPNLDTRTIKSILIRGAARRPDISYPNPEWGYGALNLIRSFEIIRGRVE